MGEDLVCQICHFLRHRVQADAASERREAVQYLEGLSLLQGRWYVAQRAHVMQPVGELYDQGPWIDDSLRLVKGRGAGAVVSAVETGELLDKPGDLAAEVAVQL